MILSDEYILRTLHGHNYLLPVGQKIVSHSRCLEINDTGRILWDALVQGASRQELIDTLAACNTDSGTTYDELADDTDRFIDYLKKHGVIKEENTSGLSGNARTYYRIGKLSIAFYGDTEYLHPYLSDFTCSEPDITDQQWVLRTDAEPSHFFGRLILSCAWLNLFECSDGFVMMFPSNSCLSMCRITADASCAEFYCKKGICDTAVNELFYGFRNAYLLYAANHGLFALHSSSIFYNNRAWLFSAPSGTGKSTHTGLWQSIYNTPCINGDINLIGIDNGHPVVYGIPWCGTSGIYTNAAYPLGGIILLKRDSNNFIEELSEDKRQLLVAQRMISHTWNSSMFDSILKFTNQLQQCIPVCRLHCNPRPDAAVIMKQYIDSLDVQD